MNKIVHYRFSNRMETDLREKTKKQEKDKKKMKMAKKVKKNGDRE